MWMRCLCVQYLSSSELHGIGGLEPTSVGLIPERPWPSANGKRIMTRPSKLRLWSLVCHPTSIASILDAASNWVESCASWETLSAHPSVDLHDRRVTAIEYRTASPYIIIICHEFYIYRSPILVEIFAALCSAIIEHAHDDASLLGASEWLVAVGTAYICTKTYNWYEKS